MPIALEQASSVSIAMLERRLGFAEVGLSRETENGTVSFIPRLFCVQNSGDDDACGTGMQFSYTTLADARGAQWDFSADYEVIDDRQTGSLRIARSREIFDGLGTSRSSLGASMGGALEVAQTVEFNW